MIEGEHERTRGLFTSIALDGEREAEVLTAPFQFHCSARPTLGCVPALGELRMERQR